MSLGDEDLEHGIGAQWGAGGEHIMELDIKC